MANKRSRRDKKAPEPDKDEGGQLEMDYWPEVDEADRPREVVFDFLHTLDAEALRLRGYAPVFLRNLRVKDDQDVLLYNRYLLRGVIDGTVKMTKERAEALELDMRHRQMLAKVNFSFGAAFGKDADIKEVLNWDQSRHTMDNTTIVPQAQVVDLIKKLRAVEKPLKSMPKPKLVKRGKKK